VAKATMMFPPDFLWGTATASYQVEGNNHNSDWWTWEQGQGNILQGDKSGLACNWWENAEADYSQALVVDGRQLPTLIGRAEANMMLKAYDMAIADLDAAIALDPQNAEIINLRANAHLKLDDLEAAQRDAERANKLDDELPLPYLIFGLTELERENPFQAVVELTEAIDLDPEMAQAFSVRGRAHALLDDPDRARADAARAIELDPELADGYMVRALTHTYELEWSEALTDITIATTLTPNDPLVYETRGLIYLNSGDAHSALDDFDKLLTLTPDSIDGHLLRASALDELGRYDDAIAELQSALMMATDADTDAFLVDDVELAESIIADMNQIPQDEDGFRRWHDIYQDFSIAYPANWRQYVELGADAPLAILGPLDKDYRANLTLFVMDFEFVPSARELARFMNPDSSKYDDYDMLSDTSVSIGGRSAVRRVFTWTASDQRLQDVSFTIVQTYVVDGKRALVFTTFARTEDFEKYEPIFDTMMDSVQFE